MSSHQQATRSGSQSSAGSSASSSRTSTRSRSNSAAQEDLRAKQAAIFGYYPDKDAEQELADDIDASGLSSNATVYMGNYGVSKTQADIAHSVKGGKYAPLIRANAEKDPSYYQKRAAGVKGDKAHSGKIPSLTELVQDKREGKIKSVQYHAYRWGLEAGRRFRDEIRTKQEQGIEVDSWQFDEIWPSASQEDGGKSGVTGAMKREYLRGFIEGLSKGRKEEGDQRMKGIVHVAHVQALSKLGDDGEMKKFWETLNDCASYIVGEEYPGFAGGKSGAQSRAAAADAAVDRIGTYGKAGKGIKNKYVAGLTPGYRGSKYYSTLGGKASGQSDASADAWRADYIAAREADGVAGLGEYNWLGDSMGHAKKVTKQVAKGAKSRA